MSNHQISLELFSKSIESIRLQLAEDKKNSEIVAEIFQSKEFNLYNTDKLVDTIIDLLAVYFDRGELIHYMFCLNFGKISDEEDFESIEEFFKRLNRE